MSKIKAVDFANNVNANRQRLIQHAIDNGKTITANASLDEAVTVNNTINVENAGFKVEFVDIDGTIISTQYVQSGESATVPANPNYDSEYLEFVQWNYSLGDSPTNVTRDMLAMPEYKSKEVTINGNTYRPTYLFCYFEDSNKSPNLYFGAIGSGNYIDWGDGSAVESLSTTTPGHTYTNAGSYIIKIYGAGGYRIGNSNTGVFGSTSYRNSLQKAYIGSPVENANIMYFDNSYALNIINFSSEIYAGEFNSCFSLRTLNAYYFKSYPSNMCASCKSLTRVLLKPTHNSSLGFRAFYGCGKLDNVFLPENLSSLAPSGSNGQHFMYSGITKIKIPNLVRSIESQTFAYSRLKSIDLNNVTTISTNAFAYCMNLENVYLPSSVSTISSNCFMYCNALKSLLVGNYLLALSNFITGDGASLQELILPPNYNANIAINEYINLSKNNLIDIANKFKDNSGLTAKTFSIRKSYMSVLNSTYLDANGQEVSAGTTGAVSMLEFITNKNWTVTFTAY